jgi:uncharacterized RDD family membrane protein YckC
VAIEYDARDRYLARRDKGAKVEIVAPEGIPLNFVIAPAGDRASAFIIDALILLGSIILIAFAAAWGFGMSGFYSWVGVFVQLAIFLGGNFYFTWFELRWQGRTPGKRAVGIRVIDAAGGPLTADAVIGRNLMRQLEVLIPMGLIAKPDLLWPTAGAGVRALCLLWVFAIALMPIWNKHRLRVGDMIAGTMVVLAPKSILLEDTAAAPPKAATTYQFTKEQLDVYGIYELQVLEDVLRVDGEGKDKGSIDLVCEKIKVKIGWDRMQWSVDARLFLREFYAALRARLEQKMLFGKRKEDKYAR